MRHGAWLAGCVLVVSCTVNSSNLNVDAGNTTGATRLYERAGMHPTHRWAVYAKVLTGLR